MYSQGFVSRAGVHPSFQTKAKIIAGLVYGDINSLAYRGHANAYRIQNISIRWYKSLSLLFSVLSNALHKLSKEMHFVCIWLLLSDNSSNLSVVCECPLFCVVSHFGRLSAEPPLPWPDSSFSSASSEPPSEHTSAGACR